MKRSVFLILLAATGCAQPPEKAQYQRFVSDTEVLRIGTINGTCRIERRSRQVDPVPPPPYPAESVGSFEAPCDEPLRKKIAAVIGTTFRCTSVIKLNPLGSGPTTPEAAVKWLARLPENPECARLP